MADAIQCVILAGGLGTRLGALTHQTHKTLLSILEKPFAHYQLSWLAAHGVTHVVYSIGYQGEKIREFVRDGSNWNLSVRYVDEGKNLLGTAGALRLALDQGELQDNFFVLYGDSFLPIDFEEVWHAFLQSNSPALMTVLENKDSWDKSNAIYSDGKVDLYDKHKITPQSHNMAYIDYGLSAFQRKTISDHVAPSEKKDLAEVFHQLSLNHKLAGFLVHTRFYEIGSLEGLKDFSEWVQARGKHDFS